MMFWSPEQIAERLRLEGSIFVSYATIYRALENGCINPELRQRLRIKYRPYRKGHKGRTGRIPVDCWIDERPKAANSRTRFGHWESDTMLGKAGGVALATHVERKSRYTVAAFIPKKNSAEYTAATIALFKLLPSKRIKSLTVDHGKEFSKHRVIRDALQATVYFAHPNCPGERGTNENTNGLLRQWFPKRSDFAAFSQDFLSEMLSVLNLRPRKCLGWRSPYEVFFNKVLHFT
jgi:IS30 family transposase